MKSTGYISLLLVCGLGLFCPAWANIYTFTADDGTVSLSNVPVDSRYKLMVATVNEPEKSRPDNVAGTFGNKARFEKIINEVFKIVQNIVECLNFAVLVTLMNSPVLCMSLCCTPACR